VFLFRIEDLIQASSRFPIVPMVLDYRDGNDKEGNSQSLCRKSETESYNLIIL
jgi:hypothetical protein